jgi:hypothetical protein
VCRASSISPKTPKSKKHNTVITVLYSAVSSYLWVLKLWVKIQVALQPRRFLLKK